MKIKLEEKVIPQRTETVTTFICETCGTEHNGKHDLNKCSRCGKDVCTNCKKTFYIAEDTLYFDTLHKTFSLSDGEDGNTAIILCKDCYDKLKANEKSYVAQVDALADDFNERLEQLNDMYLKGECK